MSISLLTLKHQTTPKEYADFIKQQGAISWWETGGYWLVTEYDLAKEILLDERFSCDRTPFFIRRMPEIDLPVITNFFSVVSEMMVMKDRPAHHPRRRICTHGLNYFLENQLASLIDDSIERSLNHLKTATLDLVAILAEPLPAIAMAALFGIAKEEQQRFYQAAHHMTMFFGGASRYSNEEGARVDSAAKYLLETLEQLLQQECRVQDAPMLYFMKQYQQDYALTDFELVAQMVMLLVAGQVTLTDQLCHNLYTIMTQPGLWRLLREHPNWSEKALEEATRLDPAVTFTFRVVKEDLVLQGCAMKQGDAVFISNHAVNRDSKIFFHPDEWQFDRHQTHLSLGYGAHFCLGAKVGMLQMRLVLEGLLKRFASLKVLEDESERIHGSLAFSGFKRLVVECPQV